MTHDPRELEWQRRYQQNDTPWDKGEPAPALAGFLRSGQSAGPIAGHVLVPGCGRGHDVRALAAVPEISAVGLDVAPAAVAQAAELAARAGLGTSAQFVTGDFFQLAPAWEGSFDWLVEHTCFCAIDPALRPDYIRAAASVLREGGKIFGIFYLTPNVESGPPFAVSREELSVLFDPHFTLLEEWVPRESFPGREGRELVRILQKRR